MANAAIPTKARHAVALRDAGTCWRCGMQSSAIHHRMRRREAGHPLWCLISLCGTCHRWAHANPTAAREKGFIIPTYEKEPEKVPVYSFAGPILLNSDGSVSWLEK